jgi:hypothetical protein
MSSKDTTVWEVYDLSRDARYNRYLYDERAQRTKQTLFVMDVMLAAVVPGSAIAKSQIWGGHVGSIVWGVFVVIAAFLAVARPFLKLPDKLAGYAAAANKYRKIDVDLGPLRQDIESSRTYGPNLKKQFQAIRKDFGGVEVQAPPSQAALRRRKDIQRRVNEELPKDRFFVPNTGSTPGQPADGT